MTVAAEILQGLISGQTIARNVIHQYEASDGFVKSTCYGRDDAAYVGMDITVQTTGTGTLLLDGLAFKVPAGGISLTNTFYDKVEWSGAAATITIQGTSMRAISAALGVRAPTGTEVIG